LYCLSFLLAIVLSILSFGHCIVCPFFLHWPNERTDNAMTKRKDRHYNGQKKGQTMQWPEERTENTMAKRKDRQSLYCLSFLLAIVLFVFFNSQLLITSLVSSNFS
jgi:hypothetical protein